MQDLKVSIVRKVTAYDLSSIRSHACHHPLSSFPSLKLGFIIYLFFPPLFLCLSKETKQKMERRVFLFFVGLMIVLMILKSTFLS